MASIDDVKLAKEALLVGATVLGAAISVWGLIQLAKTRRVQQ